MDVKLRERFDDEVEAWISEGILLPVPQTDEVHSIIPLMAIEQAKKGKVRPVLDFRRLNEYVSCHSGGSVVCEDTLRRWRKMGANLTLLDLRKAYLQLHVDRSLWKYQVVRFKEKNYYLTRLGFGLNCAPRIMNRVLNTVLSMDESINRATDHYLDDVIVDESVVSAEYVRQHLSKYGLEAKPAVKLFDGAKVLGLGVGRSPVDGSLIWKRVNSVPAPSEVGTFLSRRELFSICGQLVGHYPVAGHLRVACSYIKRSSEGSHWEDDVGETARTMLKDLLADVASSDPVGGRWDAMAKEGKIWCDASSLAVGCALEINGSIVEDASWLRKKEDGSHINMAELDSVLKGLNLGVKWELQKIEIITDSATVFSWLNSALFESHMVRTRGMNEMLVRRRLSIVKEICEEFHLDVRIRWVASGSNKADALTRVKQRWLHAQRRDFCAAAVARPSPEVIVRAIHQQHHLGVDRTFFLAREMDASIKRDAVVRVVKSCARCQSIDPAPVSYETGQLSVETVWSRVAIDVTHYHGSCYLSMIDCGPSRFAIWRRLRDESVDSIVPEILQVFRERGPPMEMLMDNARSFRSLAMRNLLSSWGVRSVFRCAYRPSGNAIVERHHRTIKRMAARANADPLDMVFYYNVTPREGQRETTVPSNVLFQYKWRVPSVTLPKDKSKRNNGKWHLGDNVFVKPPLTRCTSMWPVGVVTGVDSDQRVEVDGVPRHVADVRSVPNAGDGVPDVESRRDQRPRRTTRRPDYYGNNIYDT